MALRIPRAMAAVCTTALTAGALLMAVPSASWAQTESTNYTYTEASGFGVEQGFDVPTGVTRVSIITVGGGGWGTAIAPGGAGADVWSSHAVQPGDHLKIRVGGGARSLAAGGSASAVVRADNTPLVVAGGGGGSDITCSPNVSGGSGASGGSAAGSNGGSGTGSPLPGIGGNADTVQGNGGSASGVGGGAGGILSSHAGGTGVTSGISGRSGGGGFGGTGTNGGAGGNASNGEVGGPSAAFAHVLTLNGGGGGAGFGGGGAGSAAGGGGGYGGGAGGSACGAGGAGGSFADASPSGAPQQFFSGPFVDGTSYGHGGADAPLAGDGFVRISWNPPAPTSSTPSTPSTGLTAQTPLAGCVIAPEKLKNKKRTVVINVPCKTDAGQTVTLTISGNKGTKAKPRYKLVKANGGASRAIQTFGRKYTVTLKWAAPQTSTAAAYSVSKTYRR